MQQFCIDCGEQLQKSGQSFCGACGATLSANASIAETPLRSSAQVATRLDVEFSGPQLERSVELVRQFTSSFIQDPVILKLVIQKYDRWSPGAVLLDSDSAYLGWQMYTSYLGSMSGQLMANLLLMQGRTDLVNGIAEQPQLVLSETIDGMRLSKAELSELLDLSSPHATLPKCGSGMLAFATRTTPRNTVEMIMSLAMSEADAKTLRAFISGTAPQPTKQRKSASARNVTQKQVQVDRAKLTESRFHELAQSEDFLVRRDVAKNPHAPSGALARLAQDPQLIVQRSAIENPNVPKELLQEASSSSDWQIRWSVALNTASPSDILAVLASDSTPAVRRAVADNRNTPLHTLEDLARDLDGKVRSVADAAIKSRRR